MLNTAWVADVGDSLERPQVSATVACVSLQSSLISVDSGLEQEVENETTTRSNGGPLS